MGSSSAAASKAIDSIATVSAYQADPAEIEQMHAVRKRLCSKWKKRDFTVWKAQVYTRAGVGSSSASDAALGGFCHTFILIETDSETYILERLLEGIRFSAIDDVDAEIQNAVLMLYSANAVSSHAIATWIESQAKDEYSLTGNNCIHFAHEFVTRFMENTEYSLVDFAVKASLLVFTMYYLGHTKIVDLILGTIDIPRQQIEEGVARMIEMVENSKEGGNSEMEKTYV